jgi:phosphoribosyl-ATP pyrophosphohydrolase/phosphoribosyl-AMP cyclohydrolase
MHKLLNIGTLRFDAHTGLLPAVVQDASTQKVLMLGYMNHEALQLTLSQQRVWFYSRSRKRLWLKGETSGNYLNLVSVATDCDSDTLLVQATPCGPVCHTGTGTCFGEANLPHSGFLTQLQSIVNERAQAPPTQSYTAKLISTGIPKVAQKVGEEAVEVVIEAVTGNQERMLEEMADLLYHFSVLLRATGHSLQDVERVLHQRHTQQAH